MVWATLAKYGLYAGNMKFITQNEEWISIHVIIYIIVLYILMYTIWNNKYTDTNGKKFIRNAIHNIGVGVSIFGTFSHN